MSDFVRWLLDARTPSIRYVTLRDLLDTPADDPQLQEAQRSIMTHDPVPAIFARQTAAGHWKSEHSYYTPKYISTHWTLMLLTELHVDPNDERFQRGVNYMLDTTADNVQKNLQTDERGWSCLWGNILRYALYAGYGEDDRLQAIVEYAIRDLADKNCRCRYNDGYACAWGVARTLWGVAAIPEAQRSTRLNDAIDHAVRFLLETYSLTEANYPTPDNGKVHTLWSKLSFPLFYQGDILFTLRVLADLNRLDHPGAQPALDWLESRRRKDGRWRGSSPYRSSTWRELGDSEETHRWVSLHAALILKHAARLHDFVAA